MKPLLVLLLNNASALDYIPSTTPDRPAASPFNPYWLAIELALWIVFLVPLLRPLLKKQIDFKKENERKHTLRFVAVIGSMAVAIHIYRFVSGL